MSAMQEFSSVIASSYDAESLAPMLTEKASEGWSVVSIVSAGTNVVAYLSRGGDASAAPVSDLPEDKSDVTSDDARTPDEDHISEIEVNREAAEADEAAYSPSLPGTDPSTTPEAVSSHEAVAADTTEEPSGWGTADESLADTTDDTDASESGLGAVAGGVGATAETGAMGGATVAGEAGGDTRETIDSSGAAEHAGAPVADGSGQGTIGDATSGAVDTETSTETPAETTEAGTEEAAASGVPAGWYADPSGRFELRYWDGNAWTEHVSRAGQQYTDPPVA